MKKVLVIADCDFWAFGKIYRGIKKYVTDFQVDVHYTDKSPRFNHAPYDVVLFLCDHMPWLIWENQVPHEKLIWCIRWGEKIPDMGFYNDKTKLRKATILACSNEKIRERFEGLHDNIWVAPGGVDTDIFYYSDEHPVHEPPTVGWSGSYTGRPKGYRGLEIIKEACSLAGFRPALALREVKHRKEHQMVEYYHNDIDVYVEMSADAGRQNGLVEAGSCGIPVISSRVGIAKELLDGTNGFLCERDPQELAKLLPVVLENRVKFGKAIRDTIEATWSWREQAKIFRRMFQVIVEGRAA